MGLFGKRKIVDYEETRQESNGTGEEGSKGPTFLRIPLLGTSSGGPENAAEADTEAATTPDKLEELEERPSAQTNPSTYSTIITTESGTREPGFQSITQFIDK